MGRARQVWGRWVSLQLTHPSSQDRLHIPGKAGRAMTILGFGVTDVMLSAIIITRNEAHNIAACLESVTFCDERIVVDSGSDDDTLKIATTAGAIVVPHPWAGFGAQKNFALSLSGVD